MPNSSTAADERAYSTSSILSSSCFRILHSSLYTRRRSSFSHIISYHRLLFLHRESLIASSLRYSTVSTTTPLSGQVLRTWNELTSSQLDAGHDMPGVIGNNHCSRCRGQQYWQQLMPRTAVTANNLSFWIVSSHTRLAQDIANIIASMKQHSSCILIFSMVMMTTSSSPYLSFFFYGIAFPTLISLHGRSRTSKRHHAYCSFFMFRPVT